MSGPWLCLDFHALALEIFMPPPGQALAVTEQHRILLASETAAAAGIEPGMAIGTANALCAGLWLRERDPLEEQRALQRLALWGCRFTPAVSPLQQRYLLLDLAGCSRLFGNLQALLQRLGEELAALPHRARCALAPSPAAARLLSTEGPPLDTGRCTRADLRRQLSGLPVTRLEVPAAVQRRLQAMGLKHVGQLLDLPLDTLGKRFGREFVDYLQRLLGERADPQPLFRPPPRFASRRRLPEPLHNHQALLFPMGQLLRELCHYLQASQQRCLGFQWRFHTRDSRNLSLAITLSAARNSYQSFFSLSRLKLEQLHCREAIEDIELLSRHFAPAGNKSMDLFGDTGPEIALAPAALLDKLNARLGERAAYRLQSSESDIPELASRRRAPADAPEPGSRPRGRRPLWLLHRPAPIQRRGQALHWRSPLQLLRGPERIHSHWWRRPVQRDYFLARAESGELLWIFREAKSEKWFVHGLFG